MLRMISTKASYSGGSTHDQLLKLVELQQKVSYLKELGYKIIFCDETVFARQVILTRDWRGSKQNFTLRNERGKFVPLAVLGGISSLRGLEKIYVKPKSINGDTFLQFVQELEVENENQKLAVFVDNALIHYYRKLTRYCSEKGIELVYSLPYSPQLNPIENYWSILKRRYRQRMTAKLTFSDEVDKNQLLEASILSINDDTIARIAAKGEMKLDLNIN